MAATAPGALAWGAGRGLAALDYAWTAEDEKLADSLVVPGHASTPGFTDPAYPVEGRFPEVG